MDPTTPEQRVRIYTQIWERSKPQSDGTRTQRANNPATVVKEAAYAIGIALSNGNASKVMRKLKYLDLNWSSPGCLIACTVDPADLETGTKSKPPPKEDCTTRKALEETIGDGTTSNGPTVERAYRYLHTNRTNGVKGKKPRMTGVVQCLRGKWRKITQERAEWLVDEMVRLELAQRDEQDSTTLILLVDPATLRDSSPPPRLAPIVAEILPSATATPISEPKQSERDQQLELALNELWTCKSSTQDYEGQPIVFSGPALLRKVDFLEREDVDGVIAELEKRGCIKQQKRMKKDAKKFKGDKCYIFFLVLLRKTLSSPQELEPIAVPSKAPVKTVLPQRAVPEPAPTPPPSPKLTSRPPLIHQSQRPRGLRAEVAELRAEVGRLRAEVRALRENK